MIRTDYYKFDMYDPYKCTWSRTMLTNIANAIQAGKYKIQQDN